MGRKIRGVAGIQIIVGLLVLINITACDSKKQDGIDSNATSAKKVNQSQSPSASLNDFLYEARDKEYHGLSVADFSSDWTELSIFDENMIVAQQMEFLKSLDFKIFLEKKIEPSFTSIKAIGGVFRQDDGAKGSFFAILDQQNHLLKVQKLDSIPHIVFFRENMESIYAGSRFYTEFIKQVIFENGEYMIKDIEGE